MTPAAQDMMHKCAFLCPVPNGLHARPAGRLADVAARFAAESTLINERTGASANAKSILAIIAADVKHLDSCRLTCAGADADAAHVALSKFVHNVLPGCDEPLAVPSPGSERVLPRLLRGSDIRWCAGTPVAPGIGQGRVTIATGLALPAELAHRAAAPDEHNRLSAAIAAVRADLEARLAARPTATEAGILAAHLAIATDVALHDKAAELIAAGCSAGEAVAQAAGFYATRLMASASAYVRERAVEVEDIGLQLLERLYGAEFRAADVKLTRPSIVVSDNLTPRRLLALDRRFVQALVLERGGATSHAVILARSFGIPTLTGVADVRARLVAGQEVIVDANLGLVITTITPGARRYYELERRKQERRTARLAQFANAPATTQDGRRIEVAANVTTADEARLAFAHGADGIGLFRTEMLFMDRPGAPSEDEQLAVYVHAAQAAGGRPVVIRTIDIGGDKPVAYLNLPREDNPYLGYRGVRIYAAHRDVFRTQMRAILRASAFGKVWVMVPMISTLDEVRWLRAQMAEMQAELRAEGKSFDPALPLGIMVEVPSVAFIIEPLAAEVDFFSIGTNDLAQYFLAADRDSDQLDGLYSVLHPAFLRLLAKIVVDVHRFGRWVGMCGEMTRSTRNLPLLVGLGLDEISTSAPAIPNLKAAIAQCSAADCQRVFEQAQACGRVAEVEALLDRLGARGAARTLMEPELVVIDSVSATKEEAVREVVDAFYIAGRTEQPEAVEEAIWAREAVYSTGLGHGFAIPHCKTDAMGTNSIGVVRLARPIAWESVDGQPVECVILLAMRASDPDGAHMKVFSRLARRLMHGGFRARLLAAADREGVLSCLADELELDATVDVTH